MSSRLMGIVAGLMIAASAAWGQTTAPSTAPAVDQSTPRGAVKLYFLANARSDGDLLRRLLLGDNAQQDEIIAAIADQRNADRLLTEALEAKFPDEHRVDSREAKMHDLAVIEQNVDDSDEKIEGDTATVVSNGPESHPVTLKRVNGKWRIPLGVLRQETDPEELTKAAHQIEIQVKSMREGAADVAAGKYANQRDAVEGINQQMFTAAVEDHAATQPGQPGAGPQGP